jgi:hypothetical protein
VPARGSVVNYSQAAGAARRSEFATGSKCRNVLHVRPVLDSHRHPVLLEHVRIDFDVG